MKNVFYILSLILCSIGSPSAQLSADEVKTFATFEDQQAYLRGIDQNSSPNTVVSDQEAREKLTTREEIFQWANKMGKRGRFIIAGKLVDEQDHLLDDVEVNIQKRASGFWQTKQTTSDHLLSKFFVIELDQCDTVNLSFYKRGYLSPVYYVSYLLRLDGKSTKDDKVRNIIQKNNILFADNQRIMLLKQGEFLNLKQYRGVLAFDKSNERNEIFLLKTWKKSQEHTDINEPYFRVAYRRNSQGKILTTQMNFGVQGMRTIPEHVSFELVSNDPMDGILVVENPDIPAGKFLSTMGYAQEGKYIKSIPLPFKLDGNRINFYYRVDGRYGKGSYETISNRFAIFQNNETELSKKRNLWTK